MSWIKMFLFDQTLDFFSQTISYENIEERFQTNFLFAERLFEN